jgi:hypothetical protein
MISPGGMPFCLVHQHDHVRPSPLSWDGHDSRLVQVCIDSPAGLHEAEVAFWRSALAWRWAESESDEFAGKLYPPARIQRPVAVPAAGRGRRRWAGTRSHRPRD